MQRSKNLSAALRNRHYLPLALLITALALASRAWLLAPPEIVPATADPTEFSGERGIHLLKEFLQEGVAHPVGSAENRRVAGRIQAWLDEQGIVHEEQRAWSCDSSWGVSCGFTENIVAVIPGREAGPYVALMAHYDSVPASPGAGDDMAGVVAVLETARAIKASGVTRRPLMLLLTDGEESGLHGAHAFFAGHRLAGEVGVLLNVEGSGTRGASRILRTSSPNRWFMEAFRDTAAYPGGTSLAAEIFKRMPNDTDFSVADAASVPGIDFSFAAERGHYHTPMDRPDVLDPHTVQHHGENLFPLALALANGDLHASAVADADGDVVFQDLFGTWIQWPVEVSWLLLALAAGLLLLASLRAGGGYVSLFVAATLIPLINLSVAIAAGYGASRGLEYLNGTTVEWPAHPWAFRLAIGSAALLASCVFAAVACVRMSADLLLLGAWWFVWILVFALLAFFSEAAGVYLVMLLPAAALLCIASWLPWPEFLQRLIQAATLIPAVILLGAAQLTEDALGYVLVLATLPFVGLYLVLALPFLRGPWLAGLGAASALALLLGGVAATLLPLYSDFRPQHLSVRHYEDANAQLSHWRLITDGAVPASMQAMADFAAAPQQLLPWYEEPFKHVARTTYEGLPPPELVVLDTQVGAEGRKVTLSLASQRGAWMLGLFVPREAQLQGLSIGEVTLPLETAIAGQDGSDNDGFEALYFYGTQDQEVVVNLTLASERSVQAYLMDYAMELPNRGVVNARPAEATPVHSGDLSLVWQSVSF